MIDLSFSHGLTTKFIGVVLLHQVYILGFKLAVYSPTYLLIQTFILFQPLSWLGSVSLNNIFTFSLVWILAIIVVLRIKNYSFVDNVGIFYFTSCSCTVSLPLKTSNQLLVAVWIQSESFSELINQRLENFHIFLVWFEQILNRFRLSPHQELTPKARRKIFK
jgi:hypothetical protein